MEQQQHSASPAAGRRTARELLEERGELEKNIVAVKVDGELYDLHTPLPEGTTEVKPVRAHEPDALPIIRHSTAHVMADAVQKLFPGTKVAFGPATANGFYYDYDRPGGTFGEDDLRAIEEKMAEIIAEDSPFRREVMTKDELRALLKDLDEPFKLEHLERLEGELSVYRHGDWVDLCEGPHVPSTGFLKAFKLTHVAGAYWRGDERNPMLQRIYGTAFAKPKLLKRHLKQLEEAKKRDHRKLGKELELIQFHPLAPASPFFTPRGARVYNLLVDYIRELYDLHGYEEVITPQIFDNELFETSGHLPAYYENMYLAASKEHLERASKAIVDEPPEDAHACEHTLQEHFRFGVKPMNCPSHCLMFGMTRRSYRELPMRIADFGRLHRFERSGVVQGLTRVRTFAQDDAHIFCTQEQVAGEIGDFIDLVQRVYGDFEFADARIYIATRPDKRIGGDEVWDMAESALIEGVKAKGVDFEILDGEGAFYGPKVEFHLEDAIGRSWQLGTIQADFNLPERFDLGYIGPDNEMHRPVMLHRAVLGSVERFMGVLIEHLGGNFPVWLAPEQLTLVTVASDFDEYALEVRDELVRRGFRVSADTSNERLGAKIRSARLMRVPYIGVIGAKEQEGRGLALRSRDENKDIGFFPLDE
ncbi:MAG TPA: threonine--tRNA ligase, partial [Polyangiaceae bacterium LLY-WYZ-15_(1-7)]|nr:threonine--tRNA ligase [Polyangiaceae bacterium LLY-WYZ-15_(1-7)]